jgi:predicted RNase H-like HicB family nuclease
VTSQGRTLEKAESILQKAVELLLEEAYWRDPRRREAGWKLNALPPLARTP